jgi:cell division protein FtsB
MGDLLEAPVPEVTHPPPPEEVLPALVPEVAPEPVEQPLDAWLARGRRARTAVEGVGQMAASRIRWDRVGRWALICVFVLILYLYIGPARSWFSTYAEAKRKRAEVAELKARHADLEARAEDLSGPDALERQARELGMVKAGERSFVVGDLPK